VPTNELGPSGVVFAFRCRTQAVSFQDMADGLVGNVTPQIGQGTDDAILVLTLQKRNSQGTTRR
jgi:hypothetical protein